MIYSLQLLASSTDFEKAQRDDIQTVFYNFIFNAQHTTLSRSLVKFTHRLSKRRFPFLCVKVVTRKSNPILPILPVLQEKFVF